MLTLFSEKVDIWSAGTVLYTMLSGLQPFESENISKLISMITLGNYSMKDPIWQKISLEGKALI